MEFRISDEQEMVVRMVRDFGQKEVLPIIREWDRRQEMAPQILPRMAELGILRICVPERYGGQGFDYLTLGLVCEELEAVDSTLRVVMSVHMGLNSLALLQWGNEAQRQAYLVPQAPGGKITPLRPPPPPRAGARPGGGGGAPPRGAGRRRLCPQRREDVDIAGDEGSSHPVVRPDRPGHRRRPARRDQCVPGGNRSAGGDPRRHPRQTRGASRLDRLGALSGRPAS